MTCLMEKAVLGFEIAVKTESIDINIPGVPDVTKIHQR